MNKYGPDTFRAGTLVKSMRTGFEYLIETRDYDTLEGEQVYIVRSTRDYDNVLPLRASELEYAEA
jgi:hypothetical protein